MLDEETQKITENKREMGFRREQILLNTAVVGLWRSQVANGRTSNFERVILSLSEIYP